MLTQKTQRENRERERERKRDRESVCTCAHSERPRALWLLFLYVFFLPLGLPYVNWASQESCLFYLRSYSGLRTFLCSIFSVFSLPCLLATAILVVEKAILFPILTT